MAIELSINGVTHRSRSHENANLLSVLREEMGLCGTRFGCGEGECGACMVLMEGKAVASCNLPIWSVKGKPVVTIEGLGKPAAPHPLQVSFIEERAGQCGYCLSGVMVAAAALLGRNASPTRDEICAALEGNLCRCGSHSRIIRAVQRAAEMLRAGPVNG